MRTSHGSPRVRLRRLPLAAAALGVLVYGVLSLASGEAAPRGAEVTPDVVSGAKAAPEPEQADTPSPVPAEPAHLVVVAGEDPAADDASDGTASRPVRTLERALQIARGSVDSGTAATIRVQAGTYRESLVLDEPDSPVAPLTIEAAPGADVVVTGADVWDDWTDQGDGTSRHRWQHDWGYDALPDDWNAYWEDRDIDPVLQRRELVVVDGQVLEAVGSGSQVRERPGTFHVDEDDDALTVHPPPGVDLSRATVEVGLRDQLLRATGWNDLTIRGITFRHAAGGIQQAAVTLDQGQRLVVEDTTLEWNNWGGLRLLNSVDVEVRNTAANANGVMGFSGWRNTDLQFTSTDNSYNNWRGERAGFVGWDTSSKFMSTRRGVFTDYRAVGNRSHGLWLDYDDVDVRVEDSLLAGNGGHGLFLEAAQGPISVSATTICDNGRSGILDGKSDRITIEESAVFGNADAQLLFGGEAGGRPVTAFDSGEKLRVRSQGWTVRDTTLAATSAGQLLVDTYLSAQDWEVMRDSLSLRDNVYVSPEPFAFGLPENVSAAFEEWSSAVDVDRGSTFDEARTDLACPGYDGLPTRGAGS